MNVVGKVSSFITQGMYSVATPFHPFGGAVDIIVVKQEDGTFRSTPWYVRFGKFQGVLKGTEKLVRIEVNGVEANFHMHLDNSGEAYFVREIDPDKDDSHSITNSDGLDSNNFKENDFHGQHGKDFSNTEVDGRDERGALGMHCLERLESDCDRIFYEFQDEHSSLEGSVDYSDYDSSRYDTLESVERSVESQNSSSEVVLVSIDGHILTAPLSSSERNADDVELSTPQFHLGPGEGTEEYNRDESSCTADYLDDLNVSICKVNSEDAEKLNSATLSSEHQIYNEGEQKDEAESASHDRELCIRVETESTSSGLERHEVFTRSLELGDLAVYSTNGNPRIKGSSVEILEEAEQSHDNFTPSPVTSNKTEEKNLEIPTSDEVVLPSGIVLEPQVEVGNPEGDFDTDIHGAHKKPIQYAGNGEESQKQAETDVVVEEKHCEAPDSEDKCSNTEHVKPLVGDLNEDLKSDFLTGICESENTFHTDIDGADSTPILINDDDSPEQEEADVIVERKHDADSKPIQYGINDEESQERAEVDVALKRKHSESADSEDECIKSENVEPPTGGSNEDLKSDFFTSVEISMCGNLVHDGMGLTAAEEAFEQKRVSQEEFKLFATSIMKNENLIIRLQGKYLPWDKAAHVILGMLAFGLDLPIGMHDAIPVERDTGEGEEDDSGMTSTPSRKWRLWPIPFRRVKALEHSASNSSSEEVFVDSESISSQPMVSTPNSRINTDSPRKQIFRTNVPTTEQIESLNLKEGQNMVNFVFSTRVLGSQKVEAHIYLWKWNTKIVISDVDGTITKSDVLGQFMPLVGKDWTHSGIARLFSAIKENGYQLLFLSARAIVQAYLTKNFLLNLKQDGKSLPSGPVVISPDGLFPSLYREVIRRAPHEFKIACLEDIKALFPPDYNPFYAGFGNRDTDELSYRKIGIPKGKIFIINPKGEVAINHRIDVKSYTSLHTLVNDMFPPTELVEEEDYNSWNYWKMSLPDMD